MGFFKRSVFEPHPEGLVGAVLVDSKEVNGKYGPQIQLSFDTDEQMQDGRAYRINYWISGAFNAKSNSYKFFKGCGVDVDRLSDEEIDALDPDDYLNQRFQLSIVHTRTPDGGVVAKIDSIIPGKRKLKWKPAEQAAALAAPKQSRQEMPLVAEIVEDPFDDGEDE